jgi:hypothetical protein
VEFDGKEFVFYDPGEVHKAVLSNNPYVESLRYLKNFKGFGGEKEVQHRWGSNERFVSVAHLLTKGAVTGPVDYCFGILDTVSQADTRWSLVYDPRDLCIYLKFHMCPHRQEIHLNEFLGLSRYASMGAQIDSCQERDHMTLRLIRKKENQELMESVFGQLKSEMDFRAKASLMGRMISYSKAHIHQ